MISLETFNKMAGLSKKIELCKEEECSNGDEQKNIGIPLGMGVVYEPGTNNYHFELYPHNPI